jgi:hypothetical protein
MSLFCQGLKPVLHEHLMLFWGCTLNELVSSSIEQEDTCRARIEEERKKRPLFGPTEGALPKYRLIYTPPLGQSCCPLHLSSGATIHLNRWYHVLQSTHSRLLHLKLRSLLGQATCASTTGGLGTSLESSPSLGRATLLGPCHHLAVCRR